MLIIPDFIHLFDASTGWTLLYSILDYTKYTYNQNELDHTHSN